MSTWTGRGFDRTGEPQSVQARHHDGPCLRDGQDGCETTGRPRALSRLTTAQQPGTGTVTIQRQGQRLPLAVFCFFLDRLEVTILCF